MCVSLECPVLRKAAEVQQQTFLLPSLNLLETKLPLATSLAKAKQCWCVPSCRAGQELGHKLSGTRAHAGLGPCRGRRALAINCTPAGVLVPAAGGSCLLQRLEVPSGEGSRRLGRGAILSGGICLPRELQDCPPDSDGLV